MNFINEFALLFAVATPLVVLFAMNLFLMIEGERGTLMFPTLTEGTPGPAMSFAPIPAGVANEVQRARIPANQSHYLNAA